MKTWVHRFSSKFFARKPITILPRVWFAGAFQVSCAICKTFFGIYRACWHINQFLAELHFLSKGMRIAIRSGSIQWCRRMIRGVWVLANQNVRLRSRVQRGGGIGHGLVGTRLSWVNRVLFENISWESRFLNPCKSKTQPKIMKLGMVSRHGTYTSRNIFHQFWRKFYYKPLTNWSFSQRSLVVPIGKRVPLVGKT